MKTAFKRILAAAAALCVLSMMSGCGSNGSDTAHAPETTAAETTAAETTAAETTETETTTEESSMETTNDMIQEAIEQENAEVELSTTDEAISADEFAEAIPSDYLTPLEEGGGTIEDISYTAHDYFGDGAEITKSAHVYLPAGYSEDKKYNVLYLMHGIGGDENEWGMNNDSSRVKLMMDNLIAKGEIEPFIVVTPNGRSAANFSKNGSDFNSFYVFGQELRNDLIPYIEKTYSTYAEYDENGYDMTASRDHRAMAGLSMGGMQTINIGIGECIDLFSYFGAFSAAPTSNPAGKTAAILKENTYDIRYFYNICGIQDNIAYQSASTAAKNIPDLCDQFVPDKNFAWQELSGGHDFNIWYLGFYNFARVTFRVNYPQ